MFPLAWILLMLIYTEVAMQFNTEKNVHPVLNVLFYIDIYHTLFAYSICIFIILMWKGQYLIIMHALYIIIIKISIVWYGSVVCKAPGSIQLCGSFN